ncbi:MAG: hypothetical protein NWF04_01625 [Candidatus Bathyarchaeota archaeon]|nr:hypothetical protein [Candidatus Bathyarchaeota archaeon]
MTIRKTIRPVTLKRIIQVCSLAYKEKIVDTKSVSNELGLSLDRGNEIVLELQMIGLLTEEGKTFSSNSETKQFLEYFENNNWKKIHEYFLLKYRFYKDFIEILEKTPTYSKGLTLTEIKDISEKESLSLNQTAVEVVSDWCERLGVTQRHLFSRRIYIINNLPNLGPLNFKETVQNHYRDFCALHHKKSVFIEIPALREDICEKMRLKRKSFDEMLKVLFLENIGRMELSGAPITTLAKESPLSEKKMQVQESNSLLCPKFEACKQREGLIVGKKAYYYLSIYERL